MKVFKEKEYLIFDYENGKNVKYNLATNEVIGIKGYVVKDLCSQLRGFTMDDIITSCTDENYRRFLTYIFNRCRNNFSNIGTMLSTIKDYKNIEQLFSSGIKNIEGCRLYTINDIPKGLLRLVREHEFTLSISLINSYKAMPDYYNIVFYMEFESLTPNDIVNIFQADIYFNCRFEYFVKILCNIHNYKVQALFNYIDYLCTYEALGSINFIATEIKDYIRMVSKLSNKFEKYPRNFLTVHKIATRNHERLLLQYDEDLFKKQINKDLEYTYKEYKFIYPSCIQDIKDEAVQQNNCVASYIPNVLKGISHIMFLRNKYDLDKSLVTIEVKDKKIVQARGKCNRELNEKENEAVKKWNEKFKIKEQEVC